MAPTLTVGNLEQKIIFLAEMRGQISDGFWENAKPEDHWQPWCNLTWDSIIIDPNNIGTLEIPFGAKRNYNFSSRQLLDIVGTRIRAYVVWAKLYPEVTMPLLQTFKHGLLPEALTTYGDDDLVRIVYGKTREAAGVTQQMIADVFTKLDAVYPYKQLRKDCKALKKAFRLCKEFPLATTSPEPTTNQKESQMNSTLAKMDDDDDVTPTTAPAKPKCKLTGANGNIFNLIGLASGALRKAGLNAQAKDMTNNVMCAESYNKALVIIGEYVDIC